MALLAGSAAAGTGWAGCLRTALEAAFGVDFQGTAATWKTLDAIAAGSVTHVQPELSGLGSLPVGIMMFYRGAGINTPDTRTEDLGYRVGDTIGEMPGWKVFNGQSGTPDCRGLFIRGGSTPGATGGSNTLPNHQHTVANHSHTISGGVTALGTTASGAGGTGATGAASGNTGSYTLLLADIPAHAHGVPAGAGTGGALWGFAGTAYANTYTSVGYAIQTESKGSGGGHVHTLNSHTHTGPSHTHDIAHGHANTLAVDTKTGHVTGTDGGGASIVPAFYEAIIIGKVS